MSPTKVSQPIDLYLRVSDVRGRSGESFISLKDQEHKARAFCALKGYEVGQVFTDEDETGGKMDRPEFETAMQRALNGESGGIVCAKLDRFARNTKGLLDSVDQLERAGAVWGCAEPTIDTADPVFGRFLLTLFGAMAELELGRIGVAWDSAKSRAVLERGIHLSRHCPPGYVRDERENGVSEKTGRTRTKILGPLKPHPHHGVTITKAYEMAAQNMGAAKIAAYLNERGLPSGDNEHAVWKSTRIKRLLGNRVYLGEARYGDIVNPQAHPPLTDTATWLLVQRETIPATTGNTPYLLTGLVRCASCRHSMRPQRARGKTVGSYRCATDASAGRCPHPTAVSMNRLEDYIFEQFTERVFAAQNQPAERADDSALREELRGAQVKLDEVLADEETLTKYGVFEQAKESALSNIGTLRRALESPHYNLDKMLEEGMAMVTETLAHVEAGGRVLDKSSPEAIKGLHALMSNEIRAVFVRPAASRSNKTPITDRVHIVWKDDPEEIELPRRGHVFEPLPYSW